MQTAEQVRQQQVEVADRPPWLVVWCPALVAVAVLPVAPGGFHELKLLVLAVTVAWAGARAAATGRWHAGAVRELGVAGVALAAFVVLAVVTTVGSDAPAVSLLGPPDWDSGLLAYLLCAGILLGVVTLAAPAGRLGACAAALACGAALAVLYWAFQLAGWDPLHIAPSPSTFSKPNPFTSTLGNPNYAGAFAAAALPAGLWAALRPGARPAARAWWLLVTALLAWGVLGSDALQAPLAAAGALGIPAAALLARRDRRLAGAALVAGVALVAVAGLGLAQVGPLARLGRQDTFVSRTWDWTAAARIAADHPLTGVGFARFDGYVRAYRPPGDIVNFGWRSQAAAAHNVPLDLAAGGGWPLLAAYLAFVVAVGVRLVRGLFTLRGDRLVLLGVFGGIWAAYQAQSLVSIDVVHLVLLHFLSAGAILALTARPDPPVAPVAGGPERRPAAARWAVYVAGGVLVAVAAQLCVAEVSLGVAMQRAAVGRRAAALDAARFARAVAPWQPAYGMAVGELLDWAGARDQALAVYLQAVRRDPRDLSNLITTAGLASTLDQRDLALALLERAVAVEPQAAEVKVRAARAALATGRPAQAVRWVDAALAFDPANIEARKLKAWISRQPGSGG